MSCFPELRRRHPSCRLAVYSSMSVYQTPAADDPFGSLYAHCLAAENVDYRGSIAQQQLARELAGVSILAYPNTFAETSCIAVLEALAAGLLVVTCDLGALRETCQGFCRLISPQGPPGNRGAFEHAFTAAVDAALNDIAADPAGFAQRQFEQSRAVAATCNWDVRAAEWERAAARWIATDG
jgi:glycosyltransferase involved in cell wall biosynthesis